ncbi:MAG TPA: PsiF family protein [Noviherbaspirillum sp.]|nr:PsiF family protein [Noviherbaspirillum sp.]
MKKLAAALMLTLPFILPATAATEQQNKMATCNKEAGDMKGDERKKFMSECLSSKPKASDAQKAQQEKMKTCNAEAKDKKGDERKKFMSECLKKG